jgi:hypothetical protein
MSLNLYVNNVGIIKKYLDDYDPEAEVAVSDNYQGMEINSLPTTRHFGMNLNIKF